MSEVLIEKYDALPTVDLIQIRREGWGSMRMFAGGESCSVVCRQRIAGEWHRRGKRAIPGKGVARRRNSSIYATSQGRHLFPDIKTK